MKPAKGLIRRIAWLAGVGLCVAILSLGSTRASDLTLPGWSIDPDGGCHWIGDDAVAGETEIGTTDYPSGAMVRKETMTGNRTLNRFKCGVIDPDRGYAWFGTYTNPGIIVKVKLGDGTEPPKPVSYTVLNNGEGFLVSAVIDRVNGFAYFGTQVTPVYIVKVSLGEGDDAPVRVGSAMLHWTERSPFCAVIDVPNGYAYFGTDMNPAQVVKIKLGDGDDPPVRLNALTLQTGESKLWCGVIDRGRGYAYFGTNVYNARVIKIRLGEGNQIPERIGHVALSTADHESYLKCAVINPVDGYALFGTDTNPGYVVKVGLGDGASEPVRLGSIPMSSSESYLAAAVIDVQSGYAYFGTDVGWAGRIIKVDPGDSDSPPVRIGSTMLQNDENYLQTAVVDDQNGYLYFGTDRSPAAIVKLEAGDGTDPPVRIGSVVFDDPDRQARCAVIDEVNGYAYIGTDTAPGKVIKVRLSDGVSKLALVTAIELNSGENNLSCAVIDPENGFAYFGTGTTPGRVVKIALGAEDEPPVRVGAVTFADGENYPSSAVIDPEAGFAWFGTNTTPGRVVEVFLGEGTSAPGRTHALVLDPGEDGLWCGLGNPSAGYAWFGTMTSPAKVVKIALGFGNPPVRMGTLQFPSGRNLVQYAAIDPAGNYGYFVAAGYPNRLCKVALGWGWNLPEYVADMDLAGSNGGSPIAIDCENRIAYIGSRSGVLEKVSLGTGADAPERIGELELSALENYVSCSLLDTQRGNLYLATMTDPFYLTRFIPSHMNYIKGLRLNIPENGEIRTVSMYSHSASGNLRLALYGFGGTPELLWQSPVIDNTVADGWLNAPIGDGTPSQLVLETGDYWLVWQTDSMANVPSYSQGANYMGIQASFAWGEFPAAIGTGTQVSPVLTDDQWSAFIRYEPGECFETGCTISMPSHDFEEGDTCYCSVELCNTESVTYDNIPLFVVLDVFGSYYFAPSFTDMDWYHVTVLPGMMSVPVLPNFSWPEGAGTATGITWMAAMMNF